MNNLNLDVKLKSTRLLTKRYFSKLVGGIVLGVSAIYSLEGSVSYAEEKYLGFGKPSVATQEEMASENNSETELFRYSENPNVYVIDFGGRDSLEAQNNMLNRIGAFMEYRWSPKDRVLSDSELGDLLEAHGHSDGTIGRGHDYSSEGVVSFFNKSTEGNIKLNQDELRLRDLMIDLEFMRASDNGEYEIVLPRKAILSFPEELEDEVSTELRRDVLGHELSHGEFFTKREYEKYCWNFWNSEFTEGEKEIFREDLGEIYNVDDERLMVNEMQALFAHTDFETLYWAIDFSKERLWEIRDKFLENSPVKSFDK